MNVKRWNSIEPTRRSLQHVSSPYQQRFVIRAEGWLFESRRFWTMGLCLRHNRVTFRILSRLRTLVFSYSSGITNDNQSNRYDYSISRLPPNVIDQCEQAFKNVDAALKEAGADMKDVVRVHYLVPDRNDFEMCWPILQKWFGDIRPAATMTQVGLMQEDMKIEIEVTAHML